MSIQDQLRSPGFIHDDVSLKAADRIDALEAALREIAKYRTGPSAHQTIKDIRGTARAALETA